MNNTSDNIIQRVYDSFGVPSPKQRATQTADEETKIEVLEPIDLYKRNSNKAYDESKKTRPRGSAPVVAMTVESVISGDGKPGLGLMARYKRAKDESDGFLANGDRSRAELAKRQYMEDYFLPAVETVVRFSSPDELLNNKSALAALDKYALGAGNMRGYTASYLRSAYGDVLGQDLNNRFSESDPAVRDSVMRINMLASADKIRDAIGVAKQMKEMIDAGEHLASDDDYALIGRVVAYGD